jgi:electron transfer flavoprotein alpha subunit
MSNILVIAELHDGHVRKSTHSAINFARQTGIPFSILVLGTGAKAAAAEVAAFGAAKVITVDDAYLAHAVAERYAPTIAAVATSGGFDIVAFTASSFGKDIAPRVAAKLSAGYVPDISSVKADGGKLTYKRPVFAGNAFATAELTTPVQVVSVRQS